MRECQKSQQGGSKELGVGSVGFYSELLAGRGIALVVIKTIPPPITDNRERCKEPMRGLSKELTGWVERAGS